jgi:hypothetical protein
MGMEYADPLGLCNQHQGCLWVPIRSYWQIQSEKYKAARRLEAAGTFWEVLDHTESM